MTVIGVDGGAGGIANLPTYNASDWHPAFTDMPMNQPWVSPAEVVESDLVRFTSISQVTGQIYAVVDNTNPAVISGSFDGTTLDLDVPFGATGTAALTVRTTDGAQWFDSVINVEIVPKPADFDGDFDVDLDDIATLQANLGGDPGIYDLDDDGDVDVDDIIACITTYYEYDSDGDLVPDGSGTFQTDGTLDGTIDNDDLDLLAANYGAAATGVTNGDFNYDTTINGVDLSLLAGDWAVSGPEPIPEPTTLGLLAVSGLVVLKRRHR